MTVVSLKASTLDRPLTNSEFLVEGILDDRPVERRLGLIATFGFFVGFLGWAALTPLDAAAHAEGRIIVQGNRQSVQHRDGGVVSELLVRDGMHVQAGQVLVRLSAPEVLAQERGLSAQVIMLLAQKARLEAEVAGKRDIVVPSDFGSLFNDRAGEAQAALNLQRQQLQARRELLDVQQQVSVRRAGQSSQRSSGSLSQSEAVAAQLRLITEELESLRTVAARGFVSLSRIRTLERAQADLRGLLGRYRADSAEAANASGERQLESLEAVRSFRDRATTELREVQASLNEAMPRLHAARDQLARTEIRASATGTVVGLSVFTVGGVIEPGQTLMEIVPEQRGILIEARVAPDDADDVAQGQAVRVRFPGLNNRNIPDLEGIVAQVSADSFSDERTGANYYTIQVSVPPAQFALVEAARQSPTALRAGTPASVLISLRERSALQYAFEPLSSAIWRSFGEH